MITLAFGVLIVAGIAYGATGSITVFWATIAALMIGLIVQVRRGALVLSCPHCRHRAKIGATVCGHCGREFSS